MPITVEVKTQARYFSGFDRLTLGFSFALIVLGVVFYLINAQYTHYQSLVAPLHLSNFSLLALSGVLIILGSPIQPLYPRISLFIKSVGLYTIMWTTMLLAYNVQFTPFPPIDGALYHFEAIFGFNQNAVVAWVAAHPSIKSFLCTVYNSLDSQVLFMPFIACFIVTRTDVDVFLARFAILQFSGVLIYYFFPTASPASVLNHAHLFSGQINLADQFQQIHSGSMPTTVGSGLISMPSFHVIWSALFTVLFYRRKWIFYPLLIWNILLWCSTVMLGWHYVMDVVVALFMVGFSTKVVKVSR